MNIHVLAIIASFMLPMLFAPAVFADSGPVPRAALTSSIEDREPVDVVSHVPATSDHIYYFSELSGQAGRTIIHRWLHDDRNFGDVRFDIGGDRWRVWSRKQLTEDLHGDWRVQIVDAEDERVLRETRFTYGETATEAETEATPEAETEKTIPAAADEQEDSETNAEDDPDNDGQPPEATENHDPETAPELD